MSFRVYIGANDNQIGISLKISDGRKEFYQWDKDVQLVSSGLPAGCAIHFDEQDSKETLTVVLKQSGEKLVCDVPNIILQKAQSFVAYAYLVDEQGSRTVYEQKFDVREREKPADYVYTETEVFSYDSLVQRIEKLEKSGGVVNGIPVGGKTGQYLRKQSDDDYDVAWSDLVIPEQYGLVSYDQDKTITIT